MNKVLWSVVFLAAATPLWSADKKPAAPVVPAKIHGHAQDPLSAAIPDATIIVSKTGAAADYTFATDANGDYSGANIPPGVYTVMLQRKGPANQVAAVPGKSKLPNIVDYQDKVTLASGTDTEVDFDLSRQEFIDRLPPDARKQILAYRAKNAAVQSANQTVKNINNLIKQIRAARDAGNFTSAVQLAQQATTARPQEPLVWYELAKSQDGAKQYDAAIASYQKTISLLNAKPPANPVLLGAAENDLGNAYAASGKPELSAAAFDAAVKAQPADAAMYYGNEAIVLYKAGATDQAAAAADKAIAADPNKALPYFIKGQSLVQKASVDPKTQRIILPPGCADAYRKFLELDPNNPMAADAIGILQSAGEKIHSVYRKH